MITVRNPDRATLMNGNIRVTTEHAQHDAVTEEISQLKIVGQTQCRKRAAEEDSNIWWGTCIISFYYLYYCCFSGQFVGEWLQHLYFRSPAQTPVKCGWQYLDEKHVICAKVCRAQTDVNSTSTVCFADIEHSMYKRCRTADNCLSLFFILLLLHAVSWHALSCTCEHFTIRSAFHSTSITRLIHYTPFPLLALYAFPKNWKK